MSRRINYNDYELDSSNEYSPIDIEITKKSNPSVKIKGHMIWSVPSRNNDSYFGFEHYSNVLETFVKCELSSDKWNVVYLDS